MIKNGNGNGNGNGKGNGASGGAGTIGGIRVLVVDDMAIFREPIAACLRQAGFAAECAADGSEALEAMRRQPPDLVLLDLAMPKVDGMKVLRAMHADPRLAAVPVILLTAVSERQCIMEAAKLGVRDYMLKSRFSLVELVDRVRRRVSGDAPGNDPASAAGPTRPAAVAAAAPGAPARSATGAGGPVAPDPGYKPQPLLTREQSLDRADRAFDTKTMPGVVMEVIARADSPRTDSADLAALIGRDSMLAAKVLQAANSAAYASSRGMVATLPEAVRNIGSGTVRNVAASLGIFDVMPAHGDETFNPVRCWQHSLAVAVLCERLAGLSDLCPPNVAYLVGLCHDLGEILFRTAFAAEYRQVLEAQERTGMRRDAVERLMLGVTHKELVSLILVKLGLPDSIRKPIEAMSAPAQRSAEPAARILVMANAYANGLTLCESAVARVAPVTKADCRAATGQEDPPAPDGAGFAGEIVALTALLARLSAAQERELTRPLLARSAGTRVWLARDRAFSSYDPVAAALGQLATDVRVENRVPTAAEMAEVGRVVVVGRATSAAAVGLQEVQALLSTGVAADRVLWLAGKEDLPVPESITVRPRLYPVTLRDLEEFAARTPTAAAA